MTWTDEDTEALRRSDAYASEAGILPSALWKRAAEEIERLQKRLDGMVRGEAALCHEIIADEMDRLRARVAELKDRLAGRQARVEREVADRVKAQGGVVELRARVAELEADSVPRHALALALRDRSVSHQRRAGMAPENLNKAEAHRLAHKLRDPKFYTARTKRAVNSGGVL